MRANDGAGALQELAHPGGIEVQRTAAQNGDRQRQVAPKEIEPERCDVADARGRRLRRPALRSPVDYRIENPVERRAIARITHNRGCLSVHAWPPAVRGATPPAERR